MATHSIESDRSKVVLGGEWYTKDTFLGYPITR